jgi:hypothetical protein
MRAKLMNHIGIAGRSGGDVLHRNPLCCCAQKTPAYRCWIRRDYWLGRALKKAIGLG